MESGEDAARTDSRRRFFLVRVVTIIIVHASIDICSTISNLNFSIASKSTGEWALEYRNHSSSAIGRSFLCKFSQTKIRCT